MRTGVVRFAAAQGAGAGMQNDLALAVSEGLSNCVVHAFVPGSPGTMGLVAVALAGVFHISIVDDGCGMRPRGDSPGLGIGLGLIDALTASVEILQGPGGRGTEMRLTLDAPGMRAACPHAVPDQRGLAAM
jgi:anti-sigma regulatory factor (Ser/Thr protein kinase)